MNANAQQSSPPSADDSPDTSLLIETGRVLNSTLNLARLHDEALRLLARVCQAEAAVLLFVERKTHHFVLMRSYQASVDEFTNYPIKVAHRLFAWVQNENPDGSVIAQPVPDRVSTVLQPLLGKKDAAFRWCALRRRGRLSGVVGVAVPQDAPPNRGAFLRAMSDQIATALDNALLFMAVKQRSSEARMLLQSSMALSSSLELDEILNTILDKLGEVIHYDAAGVFLIDRSTEELAPIIHRGFDSDKAHLMSRKSDEGVVGYAVLSEETVPVADVRRDKRYRNARDATRSELAIPIAASGRVIGAFDLERDELGGFTEDEIRLAKAFAGLAGVAIERARLYAESLEKRRLDDELNIARSIQQTFLPHENPVVEGYDIAGMNVPSEEVGGDYYDFIPIVKNQLGIAIGDVIGKGIPAALIMAAFRASLIAEIRNNYAIRTILAKVNSLLEETGEQGRFVTGMYGVLDLKNGVFTFANAGHNPGMLLRADGDVEELKEGGIPLGIRPRVEYEERPVSLCSGDVMLWYTDGVTEAISRTDELFGEERLQTILAARRDRPAAEILRAIHLEIQQFADPDAAMDDVTMIAVKVL